MNILYFFPEYGTPMFNWQRVHIFNELSRKDINFDTFNPLVYNNPEEANEIFIKKLECGNHDLLLSSVCYEGMIFPEVLQAAKKKGIPTLCIRWDNLSIPFFDKRQAKDFDLVWLTASETTYLYDKWGANTIFLPYAANPYIFNYTDSDIIQRVCFIGNPYGSRSIMINNLTQNGINVDLYNGKNPHVDNNNEQSIINTKYDIINPSRLEIFKQRLCFKEGRKIILGGLVNKIKGNVNVDANPFLHRFYSCKFEEIPVNYSKYALCLSSTSTNHTDALSNPLKVVNLRAFEIPMSGGITICKYNQELSTYFEDGKEIVFYSNNYELIEKSIFYTTKASISDIKKIKIAARSRAEKEHTWSNRFEKVFDRLGIEHSK